MNFRIADTFSDSLARLTGQEQKAVKTTAFDLQLDPTGRGKRFHRLDSGRDANFWSVRVTRDIRIIAHRTDGALLLCYVDHHDAAYRWAERRRIEIHPRTGAAQLVELRERVEEEAPPAAPYPAAADVGQAKYLPPLFQSLETEDLLAIGVPEDWIAPVRDATEESIFEMAEHLPEEAVEALLEFVVSGTLKHPEAVPADIDPFNHPDAQRRFRVVTDVEALERALDFPWERWTIFLHPAQSRHAERPTTGPTRVAGSAGTGKTVVALHRAVTLARANPDGRVLLTTFSPALANALSRKLGVLAGNEASVMNRVTVQPIEAAARETYRQAHGDPLLASDNLIQEHLAAAALRFGAPNFPAKFLWTEWRDVVDAWQICDWDQYRDVPRLGRCIRVGGRQREALWEIFSEVKSILSASEMLTRSGMIARATAHLLSSTERPHDFAVADEAQDLGIPELRYLAALTGDRADGLFFAGDLGQRIFQQPFSWKALGIDVRGRSHTLKVNYRTSHQIRSQADLLLPDVVTDVDGNEDTRTGTISVFDGAPPLVRIHESIGEEIEAVTEWLGRAMSQGALAHEIGVFARSEAQLDRAREAVAASGNKWAEISDTADMVAGQVAIGTMELAKGLEFKAVVVMACDDEVIPSQERIETVSDPSDLDDVYETERHLLYVACTRARDHLLVCGVEPASEFLDDIQSAPQDGLSQE